MRQKFYFFMISILLFSLNEILAQDARQWVARVSGSSKKGDNTATAVAVDNSGNIYVTGWVTQTVSGVDIITMKYSPDGEKLVPDAYYTSSGKNIDKGLAIAIDTGKNVYIAGTTYETGTGYDYVILKYDSNLTPIWSTPVKYNGPGNSDDIPVSIAVSESLHIFVTGFSYGDGTGYDYATIKYSSSGDLIWAKRYNGPANRTDSALCMSLRGSADLFVSGTSVDSGYDYFTIKYNAETGDSVWSARYNGTGLGNDIARAIVARTATEVYLTGGSQNQNGNYDYLTIRYNTSSGSNPAWVSRYDGSANGDDEAYAIALHSTSRVYVTGKSLQLGSFNDITTIRYDQSNGNVSWVSSYNGTANDDDCGVAIIGGGNPYVLGYSASMGVGKDILFISYNGNNGKQNIDVKYNGFAYSDDIPTAFLSSGNALYVVGMSKKVKGSDLISIKYVNREQLKFRTLIQESLAVKAISVKSTAQPNGGNVRDEAFAKVFPKIKKGYPGYPGGMFIGNPRYDSALVYGWMRFDKGKNILKYIPSNGQPRGFDFYGDKPFVGEKKNPKRENHDNHIVGELITLKINIAASDAEITPPTLGDLIYEDSDTSNHFNGLTLRQMATVIDNYLTYSTKYPVINWTLFDTILTRLNRAFSDPYLGIVNKSPVAITGVKIVDSVWYLRPAQELTIDPIAYHPEWIDAVPEEFTLNQNYPNPFNPSTTISFDLPEPSIITLKVYDLLGREVATILNNELVEEGYQEYIFDGSSLSSGVYIYRIIINDGQFKQTKRMLLIK